VSPADAVLVFVDSAGNERTRALRGCIKVGRSPEVDLIFDEEGVSRVHCQFVTGKNGTDIQDLGSTNGTYVNGSRVREARLRFGDRVLVGRVELEVRSANEGPDSGFKTQYIGSESVEIAIDAADSYRPATLTAEATRRHLESLYGILGTITRAENMEDVLRGALETILRTLEFDFGHILIGASADTVQTLCSVSCDGSPAPPCSRTVVRRVLRKSEAVLANDIQAEPYLAASKSIAAAGALRIASAPIPLRGRVGAIYVASRGLGSPIDASDISFLSAAARQIGLAAQASSEKESLARENELLKSSAPQARLVGSSPVMTALRGLVGKAAAAAEATVLIVGESGTGKEIVARDIHDCSPRTEQPFVALNCGALPRAVVQSELFGHEKGAFTGAEQRRLGVVELAHLGTLFLDEIGELPLDVQVMLLRLLEEKRFYRVGGQQEVQTDVRFLAATNRDLDELVRTDGFRADLLYRLKVVEIPTPPLRDHREDIPEIAEYLLGEIARSSGRPPLPLSPAATETLLTHAWPGNVRELRNVLERATLFCTTGTIRPADLQMTESKPAAGWQEPRLVSLQEVEKEHILHVLEAVQWNKTKAADVLGMARITLYEKIKNYHLQPSRS
jgi:DNA-binding NtrC family response regulator